MVRTARSVLAFLRLVLPPHLRLPHPCALCLCPLLLSIKRVADVLFAWGLRRLAASLRLALAQSWTTRRLYGTALARRYKNPVLTWRRRCRRAQCGLWWTLLRLLDDAAATDPATFPLIRPQNTKKRTMHEPLAPTSLPHHRKTVPLTLLWKLSTQKLHHFLLDKMTVSFRATP